MSWLSEPREEVPVDANLPRPVADYFSATNAHDVAAMSAPFAEDAVVKDEGREHRGLEAIREWMRETIRKYDVRVEPMDVREADGSAVVTGRVSGTFPGSPITLRYRFAFDGHGISRLEIG